MSPPRTTRLSTNLLVVGGDGWRGGGGGGEDNMGFNVHFKWSEQ